jgi:hypothetical protein
VPQSESYTQNQQVPQSESYTQNQQVPQSESYTKNQQVPQSESYTKNQQVPQSESYTQNQQVPQSESYTQNQQKTHYKPALLSVRMHRSLAESFCLLMVECVPAQCNEAMALPAHCHHWIDCY